MSAMVHSLSRLTPAILSILRIVIGLVFLAHGTGKFLGFPHLPSVPPHYAMGWWGGLLELVGGALIVLGLFTRPVAFILSGEMAVAYFMSHYPKSFFPILNGGELAVVLCFAFLYFVVAGPGPLSADALLGRGKRY